MPLPSLLNLASASEERTWYYGFCENRVELPKWQSFYMRNDPLHIRHTYAFTQAGPVVLFIEPHRDRIEHTVHWPTKDEPFVTADTIRSELVEHGHTIARHKFKPNLGGLKTVWNIFPTCVTVVKVNTGLSSTACSPNELLKDLIDRGARVYQPEGH